MIKIAYDEEGNIVFPNNAIKGKKYFCPKCGEELTYRNSGKTGKGSRCPHFAHKGGGHNCDPESVLHAAFKKETTKILSSYLKENKGFIIKWTCSDCGLPYSGDLLFIAKSVEVEYDLKVCRPDIALLDDAGKVRIAIEIVNTHKPEDKTLKYYKDNGIVLVQYNVIVEDLNSIEEKLKSPEIVSMCLRPNCCHFNTLTHSKHLFERHDICPNCHKPVIIYFNENRTALFIFYSGLSKEDLNDYHLIAHQLRYLPFTSGNGITIKTFITNCRCFSGNFIFPALK